MTYFRLIFNLCSFVLPPTRLFWLKRPLARLAGVAISEGACLCGHTYFFGRGRVVIGRNTWIGIKNSFYCTTVSEIILGENCGIGPDVSFVSGSHVIGKHACRAGEGTGKSIVVGDGCWIGARVTILGGVKIGRGAIIGAGALVNKDVPADTLYAGVPAVFKRALNHE